MLGRRSALIIPLIAVLVLLLDAITKKLALEHLQRGVLQPAAPPLIGLTLVTNTGTAFGLWQSQHAIVQILPPLICACLIAWIVRREWILKMPLSPLEQVGFGLILGGAAGNMLDRLMQGQVTDFLYFVFWPAFPVFNLADALIDVGVVLILLPSLFSHSDEQSGETKHE